MTQLDPGKLTSINAQGDRLIIQPAEVKGFFRKHRNWTQAVLIIIFLTLPWTKWDGHQTILLNLSEREFNIFGVLFRAHDAPLMFFLIAGAALTLAFVTALLGRVWCGWACPQTVFIDGIFRRIELYTEGNYLERRKMQTSPLTLNIFIKKSLKWLGFFIVSSHIAHSFLAYFVGAPNLIKITLDNPANNWTLFCLVQFLTALFLFDFGWFREQFCVIMCPYGRIQGLLMDSSTKTIVYDAVRGEPRRSQETNPKDQGDCVACGKCVAACPTGIDIRNGLQLECIACTACIDACDEIMEKVNKPKGLIKYQTLNLSKFTIFKTRSFIYFLAILVCIIGLAVNLGTRKTTHISLLRASGLPFSILKSESPPDVILNQFKLHMTNQSTETQLYKIQLTPDSIEKGFELTVGQNPMLLNPKQFIEWHFFVRAKSDLFKNSGQQKGSIQIYNPDFPERFNEIKEFTLLGPK